MRILNSCQIWFAHLANIAGHAKLSSYSNQQVLVAAAPPSLSVCTNSKVDSNGMTWAFFSTVTTALVAPFHTKLLQAIQDSTAGASVRVGIVNHRGIKVITLFHVTNQPTLTNQDQQRNVGEKWISTTGKAQRSDSGEESKKQRCNQLSANQIMDIFQCSPLNQNITRVVKKVEVNARVAHLANFHGVGLEKKCCLLESKWKIKYDLLQWAYQLFTTSSTCRACGSRRSYHRIVRRPVLRVHRPSARCRYACGHIFTTTSVHLSVYNVILMYFNISSTIC